jgi:hypothetical protein
MAKACLKFLRSPAGESRSRSQAVITLKGRLCLLQGVLKRDYLLVPNGRVF